MPDEDQPPNPELLPTELQGLDPGELIARGLHTVKASIGPGRWQPPTPEELAALLPQYHIESLLGHGGMGAVYKGTQAALDRAVAIKLLPAELAGDGDFLVRFQREARTLARLMHPGIVAVFDFGQTSAGHLYFVMEYVDGTDLQRVLKGPGLKPEQAFEVITQICDALHYAHRQGVIHRDIKPANILLTQDGQAKVADFGLARPISDDAGGLTMTNMVMGTPDYMAPETRTSATHGDHRADIFALGVMLYEMLTGHRPHGAFQPPSQRVAVDVRIDEVVLKALQQEPDRRYQQASEMKTDVDRIRTSPPLPPAKLPAAPRRSVVPLVAVLAAALACAGGLWWAVRHFSPAERPAATVAGNALPPAASTPAPLAARPIDVRTIGEMRKILADARAQARAGDPAEAQKLVQQALDTAGTDLGIAGEAALVLAEAGAPEHAAKLAADFAKAAEADHLLFAPVADLRARLAARMKDYEAHLAAAAKSLAAQDEAGEQHELQAALEAIADGHVANERARQNPLMANKAFRGRSFTNSLGQKFVPLPSHPHLLFCIWETRVKDFEAFVKETGFQPTKEIAPPSGKPVTAPPYSWLNPGFPQTGDHPVVGVSSQDAEAFCLWLTQKARAAGQFEAGQLFRLPTDREWSAAMGVTSETGDFPEQRVFPENIYTWGKTWPPPVNAENLAGDERKEFGGKGPKDDWIWTAPVGRGRPNPFGIYDLYGNVTERCKDRYSFRMTNITTRGADYSMWPNKNGGNVLRGNTSPNGATGTIGFRCIIDLQTPERLPLARQMEAAVDDYCARVSTRPIERRYRLEYLVNDEGVSVDIPGQLGGRGSPTDDDLMAFADVPIDRMYVAGAFPVTFAALRKMPLKVLGLFPTQCASLATPLEGLSPEWFGADGVDQCTVSNLDVFRGMKLKGLRLLRNFGKVTDLTPLQGQPLQILDLTGTSVTDLSPVKAAPLEILAIRADTIDPQCVAWWPKLRDISSLADRLYEPAREAAAQGNDALALSRLDALEATYGQAPWFNSYRNKSDELRKAPVQHALTRWLSGDRTGMKEQMKFFHGHAYLLVRAPYKFDEAREAAEKLGGHLVTIGSQEEDAFLKDEFVLKYRQNVMIGALHLSDDTGWYGWRWVTGEDFHTYQNWADANASSHLGGENTVEFHATNENRVIWFYGGDRNSFHNSFLIEWETANP